MCFKANSLKTEILDVKNDRNTRNQKILQLTG